MIGTMSKKTKILTLSFFGALQLISLLPMVIIGLKNSVWDPYIYLDFLAIFVIVFFCIAMTYREIMVNHIRKKTHNLAGPLTEFDKKAYKDFVDASLYETLLSVIVYVIVYLVSMFII